MSDDNILETRGLTKEFKGFAAVSGVDLSVRRGAIHALIGPNGARQDHLLQPDHQFLEPTSGRILFNGRDITRTKPAGVAQMGMVRSFQISATFGHLTLLENVRVALQRQSSAPPFTSGARSARCRRCTSGATALLEDVGLAEYRDLTRQRAALRPQSARSRSPPRWRSTPRCCSSTSRPRAWAARTSGGRRP